MNSEEYKRGLEAAIHTAVFDIIKPSISLATGLKEFGDLADLRGRPNDYPVKKLINKFLDKLLNDGNFYNEIATASYNNDKKKIFKIFYDKTVDFIIDEDNAKLYLDILKQNSSNQTVIDNFKKSIRGLFKIKAAGDLTGTSVNIGETIAATITTYWTTEFIIDPNNLNDTKVTDSFNNQYNSVNLNGRLWTTENWKGTYNGTYNFGNSYIDGLYNSSYGDYIDGVSIRDNPNNYMKLPQGWRLPTKEEFEQLLNSLGSSAFQVLTNQSGFNAKPYGYIHFHFVNGNSSQYYTDLGNKSIYASSSVFTDTATAKHYLYCLVIDNVTQQVSIQQYEFDFYSMSGWAGMSAWFNLRLIKD